MNERTSSQRAAWPWLVPFVLALGCAGQPADSGAHEPAADPASGPTIEDDSSPSPVYAALLTVPDGALRDAIDVQLTNASEIEREVRLELSAAGLANLHASRDFGPHTLAPGQSVVVTVPAADLPLQSAVMPVTTVIAAVYELEDGSTGRAIATDVLARASADLRQVALHGSNTEIEHALDTRAALPGARIGRRFDAASQAFVDLDASALAVDANVRIAGMDVGAAPADDLAPATEPLTDGLVDKAATTKFCARFIYGFSDTGYGEDRLNAEPLGTFNAAYVRVNVLRGSTMVFQGFMDGSGCTPSVATPTATYTVRLFSRTGRSGKEIWAYDNEDDTTLGNWSQNVVVNNGTGATVWAQPSVSLDYADFLAIASTALAVMPSMLASRYTFFINQGCGNSSGCYAGQQIFMGTDFVGMRDVYKKYAMGHELGHGVQDMSFGLVGGGYSAGFETQPFCNCDHVRTDNALHCMQSRESVGAAQNEGFAHVIAARLYNIDSQTDCAYAYYKEIEDVNGNVTSPAMFLPCNARYSLNKNFCGADPNWPRTGVELDWMNFYWELMTKTANAFSWAEFKLLYMNACDPACFSSGCGRVCSGDSINIQTLDAAARRVWGAGSTKYGYFASTARAHGLMP
jgi:hypothetical protein